MKEALVLCLLMSVTSCIQAARILAVLPFPGKSHYIFDSTVLKALAQRGHQIVEYSPFPPKKPMPNHTHMYVYTYFEETFKNWDFDEMIKHSEQMNTFIGLSWLEIQNFMTPICDEVFKDENIKKLLQSNEHFDLVLTTATFAQETMLVFGHKFRAPTITLQGFQHSVILNRDTGNDLMIATIPESMSFAFTDQMSFIERLRNFISASITLFIYYFSHLPNQESLVRKHYNAPDMPSLAEMVTNVSLTLVNVHPAVSYPQPFTPNVVPVGGITVSSERIALPADIKKFMDDAKEGVVYFSFGTVVSTHLMPQKYLQIFINVFKNLPQKILWKIEADSLPGLPNNVWLTKWVPQPGVLDHPNCAVFITHGGVFSQLEAIQAGVPMIVVPFFADQFFNARFSEERGIGIKVDFKTISEENLNSALTTVLTNPRYKENTAQLSRIFRDVPMSPADTAVFWTEYVLRHRGAPHLRPAAASLPFHQLMLLDVAAVILIALTSAVLTVNWLLRNIGSLVFSNKRNNPNIKKNK